MISVITVTLNAEKTLEDTLISIIRQTYQNFEIVAIDGGSTDSTIDIFKKYNAYIGTMISEPDSGIYNAMNKGIRAAKGDFLFFLNAQDTLYSANVFAKIVDAFNSKNRPLIVFGDVFFTNKTYIPHAKLLQIPNMVKSYKNAGYEDPAICHQAIFYHKKLFESIGAYDEKYKIYADFDFNIRAFYYAQKRYTYIPEIISNFDLGGISTIINAKYQKIQAEENAVLRVKKSQMWSRIAKKNFLFSKAFSSIDGGYYIQLCGFRLDWTQFMKYFALEKVDFPISLNFGEELPTEFRITGFLPLEGWGRWINGPEGTIRFSLNKWNTGKYALIKIRIYLCLLQELKLNLFLNERAIGNKTFSPQTTEKTTDVELEFIVQTVYFHAGENCLKFQVEGFSNPKEAGVSGDDRLLGIGIQTMQIENYSCLIPLEYRKCYEFARPLTLPFKVSGFYSPEAWGAWLEKRAVMELIPESIKKDIKLVILYKTFLPDETTHHHLDIYVENSKIKGIDFPEDSPREGMFSLTLPYKEFIQNKASVQIRFETENPIDIHKHFHANDNRLLGVGFKRIYFLDQDDNGLDLPLDLKSENL